MKYKIIDGVLYEQVDSEEIKQKVASVVEAVRPYKDGIAQCRAQIREYEEQIASIIANSGIDREAAQLVDPEKASFLGL